MAFEVLGTGSALPARAVTNDELSAFLDTSDEWIFGRTGIKKRHVCVDESLDDLAAEASLRALQAAGVDPGQIDLVVCSTSTADHLLPSEACAVSGRLGVHAVAFDVSAACAGFILALDVADGYLVRGRAQKVLVVACERMSRVLDWSDRSTCVLFGDGAAAVVLGASERQNPLVVRFLTTPDVDVLEVPGLPGNSPFCKERMPASTLKMDGRRVFRFGVSAICDEVEALASKAGVGISDIDHFVFHQANERIIAAAVKRLGIEDARVARTLRETGNISSACIPLALDGLARAGKLERNDLVAMVGFGAGLDIGSCLLRW